MCGIAGIISTNKTIVHTHTLARMAKALAHRGPDGEGFYINPKGNIGLAHRRLAIIDLSAAAAQPMHFADKYTIVYNGEIYNYKELKKNFQEAGYFFKTESDTEVILAAYHCYQASCVQYLDGMFAFAIWNEDAQTLFCARDTFGEKPFYYYTDNDVFTFASEMKALWAIGIDKTIDEKMMSNYIALGYVQNVSDKAQTFFKNIFALPPAHTGLLTFSNMQFVVKKYNSIDKNICTNISEKDAAEKLYELLENSIKKRLQSDVPVGTSLSGGIDSSTIAYFVNKQNNGKVFKTFSAIFPHFEKDESALINSLSQSLHVQNNTVNPLATGLVNDFDKICYHQEEPFASSSIYAQYKVYELAKQHNIKVLLDGQGADEILGGYTKYIHWYLQELISNKKFIKAKKERANFLKNNVQYEWGKKNYLAALLPQNTAIALEKKEYAALINNPYLHTHLLAAIKGNEWQGIYKPTVTKLNDVLYYNTCESGLEELLRYADRNSMANGVEVRLPFLQLELVHFIFALPASLKMANGFTKYILRKTMQNKIPDNILWNPIKTGFETPQKSWMENEKLQALINDAKQTLVNKHYLNPAVMNNKIVPMHAHDAKNMDWRYLSMAGII